MATQEQTHADVAVVGAGPIGLELHAALKANGLKVVHFDAGQVGQTILDWPPDTHFFSAPERVSIAGVPAHNNDQRPLTQGQYLAYLRSVVEQLGLDVRTYERVEEIEPREGGGFNLYSCIRGDRRTATADRVIVATGDMAQPRRLGLPGEEKAHVHQVLHHPHRYFRRSLLVVGGKNSALEGALRAYRAGARVAISYRRDRFDPSIVKPWLLPEIEMLIQKGEIEFFPETVPGEIGDWDVTLSSTTGGEVRTVQADFVLMATGYVADLHLFTCCGIELKGDSRAPVHDPDTMETDSPGLHVAGTIAGGSQQIYELFIETCHVHVERIVAAITGRECDPALIGSGRVRHYPFTLEDVQPEKE